MGLRNYIRKRIKKNNFKPKLLYTYQWKRIILSCTIKKEILPLHSKNFFFGVVENRDDNFFY